MVAAGILPFVTKVSGCASLIWTFALNSHENISIRSPIEALVCLVTYVRFVPYWLNGWIETVSFAGAIR